MTDRSAVLAKLARLAAANADSRHLADRLCEAARLILQADGAWLTVHEPGAGQLRLSATDETASALEELQDLLGEGPCLTALREAAPLTTVVADRFDNRWPEFTRAALERVGELTVHAHPMRPDNQAFGVLGLYLRPGNTWTAESFETAQFLADTIAAALLKDPIPKLERGLDGGMWSARAEVHQATGMVIVQLHVPPADALALLRAHAYAHDATLGEIAHQVVTRQLDFRGDS
ncbi:GAF and ANTAR domain-containing protein [Kribbella sp. NPDC026611]|uniref:GAF and ANTAR domain-containing protein n=1 Tax=Kribbella sp. NPDC026611 TaxID=3154911 RepID=UPI0033DD17E9